MDSLNDFESRLSARLAEAGMHRYSVADLRRETRDCRDFIYKDTSQHGGDIAEPFFNFVVVDGVAVFTLFEVDFSVYIAPCQESELIAQTNSLAIIDVAAVRDLLAREYGKSVPDAALPRSIAELWLTR
ncbi:MAG: hypothetical protein KDB11_10460 [Planctomycetales bacterium]|nr:hypothetical protein [Planctomycetales bacterium]